MSTSELATPPKKEGSGNIVLERDQAEDIGRHPFNTSHLLPVDLRIFGIIVHGRTHKLTPYEVKEQLSQGLDPHNRIDPIKRDEIFENRLFLITQVADFTNRDLGFQQSKLRKKIIEANNRNPRTPYTLDVSEADKSAVIKTANGRTEPIKFKRTTIYDENNALNIIPASVQMTIFSLLFRNEPVSVSFLLKKLSNRVDTVFELGNLLRSVNKTIRDVGLSVVVNTGENNKQEFVGLGPKTDTEPALRDEKTSREFQARAPGRVRTGKASHRNPRL